MWGCLRERVFGVARFKRVWRFSLEGVSWWFALAAIPYTIGK